VQRSDSANSLPMLEMPGAPTTVSLRLQPGAKHLPGATNFNSVQAPVSPPTGHGDHHRVTFSSNCD
jgi:hypothetical protein